MNYALMQSRPLPFIRTLFLIEEIIPGNSMAKIINNKTRYGYGYSKQLSVYYSHRIMESVILGGGEKPILRCVSTR